MVLQEVHNFARPPMVELAVRQGELQRVLEALERWRYVEIRGPPGEGKSTLAQHAVQALCDGWRALPRAQAPGEAVYALEVDLRGGQWGMRWGVV
jgi:MoxR-like ATPase